MTVPRRNLLSLALAAGALPLAVDAAQAAPGGRRSVQPVSAPPSAADGGLTVNSDADQAPALQAAVDRLARAGGGRLVLAAGRYNIGRLELRAGVTLAGARGMTVLRTSGIEASGVADIGLEDLVVMGRGQAADGSRGLLAIADCQRVHLAGLRIEGSAGHGIGLARTSGRVIACEVAGAAAAGIFSIDATGLEITSCHVRDCANNGILVWRSAPGDDGTLVHANRIERIRSDAGGSGQNGNGVNVFRAGGVVVSANRITDCAYSAVRANAAADVQMIANNIARIGEVALYAEFAFSGAIISGNVIDGAAAGISVTNFNEGGRLAVVDGNLIRNLARREHEPVDKRGEGIAVEADATVTGNVIEGAPTAGIVVGWGRYMRDCNVSANVIRGARVGIAVSADSDAGTCLVGGNLISGAADGGIRAMRHGRLLGPDLIRQPSESRRIVVAGNVAS